MRGSKGFEIGRLTTAGVYLCAIAALLFVVSGCGEQLTRMEENQVKLQAMVAANARELATLSSQIHNGTGKLTEGIQNLNAQGQTLATEIQTVQGDQRRLHETVVAGNQGLDAKATGLQEGQQSLHNRVAQVQDVTGRTAADLTALAQQHASLYQTVRDNQRELNKHVGVVVSNQQGIQAGVVRLQQAGAELAAGQERLSTDLLTVNGLVQAGNQSLSDKFVILERNQQNHQAGIDRVNSAVDETATIVAAIAAAQTAMQESLVANHERITGRLGSLAESQQSLQAGIDTLNGKADRAAADSATAVSSLQETLRISRDVVTGQMAASLQNQQAVQTSVHELNGKTDNLVAGVAAVSAEQAAARDALQTNHETILTAMAGLSDGHQTLRTGIDRIDGKADGIQGDLVAITAGQKAQHEAAIARFESLSTGQADLQSGVNTLNSKADATSTELAAAAQRQNALQQSLAAVNESLAAHATAVAEGQQSLNAGIGDLSTRTQQLSGDLAAVADGQDSFRRMQQQQNDAMDVRTAQLADNQRSLQTQVDTLTATAGQTALSVLTLNNGQASFQQAMQAGMNGLHERADQTAADVHGMAERQAAFQQSIKASNESLTVQAAAVVEGQKALKADLGRTAGVVDRAYADLTAVALAQETLQNTVTGRSDEINSRVARVESEQKVLGESLGVLTATAGQTALDLLELADNHAEFRRSVKTGNEAIIARTASLDDGQKALGGQLDVLTATAGQTALDVLALDNSQSSLAKTVSTGLANLSERTSLVADNQRQMQEGMDVLTATAGQTALDVIGLAGRQNALDLAIQRHSESTESRIATLAGGQQQIQNGMDALAATTGQTAQDVIGVSSRQDALQQAVRSHSESAEGRTAKLAESQQKIRSGLDGVTATMGQTARDLAALSEAQARSEQAAQAGRVELADRLTAMTQDQQSWLQRFDATQAGIQAMADGIATLDQQLAKLQGSVQTGLQNTTTVLDTNGKQRGQFEAKVAQDVQAMIDAIAQLRQTQAVLQEQMSQMQKSTQSQADAIKATIEQLRQPPVEAKVSDAKKVEPVVVETGE